MPDESELRALGQGHTDYTFDGPEAEILERFPAPESRIPQTEQASKRDPDLGWDYFPVVTIRAPEFTSLCPKTGQPDMAEVFIEYMPHEWCLESKSLKLYLMSFRSAGMFHEQCVTTIGDDLWELLHPYRLFVRGEFTPRGGISFWPVYERVREF